MYCYFNMNTQEDEIFIESLFRKSKNYILPKDLNLHIETKNNKILIDLSNCFFIPPSSSSPPPQNIFFTIQ